MKHIYILLFLLSLNALSATNYYVSATGGNDTNTGKSAALAWKSIAKVNAMMSTFVAADSVLFKCGDTFTEQLNITKSGSSISKIVFASYGTGAKPLINTAATITGWSLTSTPNVWVANYTGALTAIRFVTMNDKVQQIGRFPDAKAVNDGFLYSDEAWAFTKFRDAGLNQSLQDWTGATTVMYTRPYRIESSVILKHQLDTIFCTTPTTTAIHKGYGYFIQNHLSTLTTQGEWYLNNATKKLYLYSTTNPSTVKVQASSTDFGISLNSGIIGIKIKNLAFQNADSIAISIKSGSYIDVDNCTFSNTLNGVWAPTSNNITVTNSNFSDIYNISIGSTAMSLNFTVTNNIIRRNFMSASMSDIFNINYKAAIHIFCTNALISYNDIDSCGYIGVYHNGWGNTISHNKIGHFNMQMFDGGGIYSFGTWSYVPSLGINKYGNNLIECNYVHDGIGYMTSTNEGDSYNRRPGIYNDQMTEYNTVRRNVLYNTHGILMGSHHNTAIENTIYNSDAFNTAHPDKLIIAIDANTAYHTVTKNTIYNSTFKFNFNPYTGYAVGRNKDTVPPMTSQGHRVTQNIFYSARSTRQPAINSTNGFKNYPQYFGVCDSNYYWQPFALDTLVAQVVDSGYTKTRSLLYGVNQWTKKFEPHAIFRVAEYPATYTAPQTNLFASNSTFTSNTTDWTYDSENVTSPGSWVSSGGLDGGCALLDLSTANASPLLLSSARLYRSIGVVAEKEVYLLKFSVISNSNTAKLSINFSSTTGTSPKMYTTSTVRKEYTIPISFNDNGGGASQNIYFTLHDKGAKVWLDNISLQKATLNQTLPTAVMRFDVNPTDNPLLISLVGINYKDVFGTFYSGSYTLEPYCSKILQYTNVAGVATVTDHQQGLKLYVYPTPNPGAEPLKLTLLSPVADNITVRMISIEGQVVFNRVIQVTEGQTLVNLPSFKKGVYLVESLSSSGKNTVTKIIL